MMTRLCWVKEFVTLFAKKFGVIWKSYPYENKKEAMKLSYLFSDDYRKVLGTTEAVNECLGLQ